VLKDLLSRLKPPQEQQADAPHLLALSAATLLLEVAWADHDIAEAELALIEQQLKRQFGLGDGEVAGLIAESREAHAASVGLHSYTRTINESWSEEQKFTLVTALWRLALADEGLHHYEEHTIRKIAELLYLSHTRFIEAKLIAKRDA
jgi:uncharacterized tellurite resistance protein B-like protein